MPRAAALRVVRREGGAAPRTTNAALVDAALATQRDSTAQLRDGLRVVHSTAERGAATAAALRHNGERVAAADAALDRVDGELGVARHLVTRFVKRVYTDACARAFLVLLLLLVTAVVLVSLWRAGDLPHA
jgi:hypothetical protein